MIIGLTGKFAAGKGEIASYLQQKGFGYFSFSAMMAEECKSRGIDATRENLINVANEMRKNHGNDYWANKIISKLAKGKNFVVESFRNPAEVNAFRKLHDFRLFLVDAPQRMRYGRTVKRKRIADFKSFEEFKRLEQQEIRSSNSAAQQLEECARMADVKIMNDSTLDALHKKIDAVIKKLEVAAK